MDAARLSPAAAGVAYAAVDRLLRGDYADLIGGEAVVLYLAVKDGGTEAVASWERPESAAGWVVMPVTCNDALMLRSAVKSD